MCEKDKQLILQELFSHEHQLEQNFWTNLKHKVAVQFGLHEKPVSNLVKTLHGNVFVDIGANYGYYSLFLRKNFKTIYAFEPSKIFRTLQRNTRKFKNIKCFRKKVGDHDNSTHVTLASVFSNTKIDLVKVDVEGDEWKVLQGVEKILENVKAWIVELHDINRVKELEDWFLKRGYDFKWLTFMYKDCRTQNHLYAFKGKCVECGKPCNGRVHVSCVLFRVGDIDAFQHQKMLRKELVEKKKNKDSWLKRQFKKLAKAILLTLFVGVVGFVVVDLLLRYG